MAVTLSSMAVAHQQQSVSNNSSNHNDINNLKKLTIQHLLTAHTTRYTLLQICGSAGLSGPLPKPVSGVSALEAASQDSQLAGRRHLPAVRSQDSERRRLPVNTQTDLPRGGFGGLLGWLPQCAKDQGETLGNPVGFRVRPLAILQGLESDPQPPCRVYGQTFGNHAGFRVTAVAIFATMHAC